MSPHPYTEDQLVEQPAIALLADLGWATVSALDEVLGVEGTLGRETKSEVVLVARLRAAIPVSLPDPERGGQRILRVRVIDDARGGFCGSWCVAVGYMDIGASAGAIDHLNEGQAIMRTLPALLFTALLLLVPGAVQAQPVETEIAGVTAEVLELRQTGGVLRLAVRFANSADKTEEFNHYGLDRIVLVDVKSKKKHFPLKDANGQYIGGPIGVWIGGGRITLKVPKKQAAVLWAYFEPVAPGTVMTVEVPQVFPFEDVPVTEGPGKVFASTTAGSTPAGVRATIVSARRADQVLNVRLRIEPERGETVDTLHNRFDSYFYFKDVFLFDPVAKRKYSLVKDTEGFFQAQPLTVKMDGGRFIHDWRKTTLVSLTFQAPPDTVQRADLLLPQFLPFEAVTIEGLGGAAAGGVEAAGRTLGLEGALKELKAEVTATEIKIDLAADVLFDFDKAEIKKQAEPNLQNLATVLKANPGATVTIDGHTDAKGADAYNQTLSEQRAASVKQWLVANAQVNGANISTRGWGKSKPVTHNAKPDGSDDPEGRAKNRRVQIIVRKGA